MNTLTNDTLTLLLHEYVQMLVLQCFHLNIFSNYTSKDGHGTGTHFYIILIKTLLNLCNFRKYLSINNKNFVPILVATLQLSRGVNYHYYSFDFTDLILDFMIKSFIGKDIVK